MLCSHASAAAIFALLVAILSIPSGTPCFFAFCGDCLDLQWTFLRVVLLADEVFFLLIFRPICPFSFVFARPRVTQLEGRAVVAQAELSGSQRLPLARIIPGLGEHRRAREFGHPLFCFSRKALLADVHQSLLNNPPPPQKKKKIYIYI